MRRPLLLLISLLLVSAPARALTVLAFGDSLTAGELGTGGWPERLAEARPELTVINAGLTGDVSSSSARLMALLAQHHPDWTVILLGVNDRVVAHLTPRETERNLRRLASLAHGTGSRVVLVTPPPVVCIYAAMCAAAPDFAAGMALANEHTRQVADLLGRWRQRPWHRVVDLRGRIIALEGWRRGGLTYDGLHLNHAGFDVAAAVIGDAIP